MANSDLRTQSVNLFHGGMNKDEEITYLKEGEYTHAINAVPYSVAGDLNSHSLSNEPATFECVEFPMTLIGNINIDNKEHVVFLTDDFSCEIGIFSEKNCTYTKLISSPCLNFNKNHLIKGVSRKDFECDTLVYWNDGYNPARVININKIPYQFNIKKGNRADQPDVKEYTNKLDCDELLLTPQLLTPYSKVEEEIGGSLVNGSYRVAFAYSSNGVRLSDYIHISDIQSLFSPNNSGKSFSVELFNIDSHFAEYELVLISNIDQQTTAERLGFYSTSQTKVIISNARDASRGTIPLGFIPLMTPFYDKGEDMVVINNSLVQFGVTTKADINYQKLANKIVTKYVAYKVPADYYRKGGNKVGYMRDEVYAFFIRYIDKTGHKTSWINIPARELTPEELAPYSGKDVFESLIDTCDEKIVKRKYEVVNTADIVNINAAGLPCKEFVVGEGKMAGWQSTEKYPDTDNWGDLRGKFIRHHKFPDCAHAHIHSNVGPADNTIVLLGVRFERIQHPVDEAGNPITDYVGFEIARSSRKGNKTIQAKGLISNMGYYKHPDTKENTLYANYGYNDLRVDPFLSQKKVKGGTKEKGYTPMGTFRDDIFTFHSPTVQYNKVNLGGELKIETEEIGKATGRFDEVYKHPKHKLIRDFALLVSGLVGVGEGLLAVQGSKCYEYHSGYNKNDGSTGAANTVASGAAVFSNAKDATSKIIEDVGGGAVTGVTGFNPAKKAATSTLGTQANPGTVGPSWTERMCSTGIKQLPKFLQIANSAFIFAYYFGQGTETALRTIEKLVPFQQYALQYNSHGFYFKYNLPDEGDIRRHIDNYTYVNGNMGSIMVGEESYQINNMDRPYILALKLNDILKRPETEDNSRVLFTDTTGVGSSITTDISSYYASIKVSRPAQYGQIDSIEVVNTGYFQAIKYNENTKYYKTDVIFGGDTYINRYTEKRIMPYFSQFLHGIAPEMPDGFEYDYTKYPNIPYPRFWINSEKYDLSQIIKIPPALPNDLHNLNGNKGQGSSGTFVIKNGHFFLFNNGIMDFYCESEMNVDFRGTHDELKYKHYSQYEFTNLSQLFRSDIINLDNYFIYDRSLSADEQMNFTNGLIQARDFTIDNNDCYTYYKNRVIYSLPQQGLLKKDNWRSYLANNYYDFPTSNGTLTAIKTANRSGALFLFSQASPMMFQGQDVLNTDLGTKISIGDGGMFSQAPQNIVNNDYNLGSSGSRWAVLSTEFGTFFTSQTHGKIFNFTGQLEEISMMGMSSWFRDNLPFNVTNDFPGYTNTDNIVSGIGFNMVFDNTYKLLYITKKDYKIKPQFKADTIYVNGKFKYSIFEITLGDPVYFDNASWTISYNPMIKRWNSFHEWYPSWTLQTDTHFMTLSNNKLWKHNERWDLFCKFYNKDSVFEIEFPSISKQGIGSLASVEFNLECYKHYSANDKYHLLDYNFDEAIIYNTEQVSGLLRLNMPRKNSIADAMLYPSPNSTSIDIAYSKEEQKYRFNQFWDILRDRGEFNNLQRQIWKTSPDGVHKEINELAVNYQKKMVERKALRHYWNKIILRKNVSNDIQMVLKWVSTKLTISLR